jgi:hypothetical protein
MKMSTIHLAIVGLAVASALATSCVQAAEGAANEYQRQQNVQEPSTGTRASRREERKERKAEVLELQRNGELPGPGDDWGMKRSPEAVTGTRQSRAAERKARRAEVEQAVKSGQMPVTNEAGVNLARPVR